MEISKSFKCWTGKDISIKDLADSKFSEFKGEIIWDNSKPDGLQKSNLIYLKSKNQVGLKIELNDGIKETIGLYRSLKI